MLLSVTIHMTTKENPSDVMGDVVSTASILQTTVKRISRVLEEMKLLYSVFTALSGPVTRFTL